MACVCVSCAVYYIVYVAHVFRYAIRGGSAKHDGVHIQMLIMLYMLTLSVHTVYSSYACSSSTFDWVSLYLARTISLYSVVSIYSILRATQRQRQWDIDVVIAFVVDGFVVVWICNMCIL